MAVEVEFHPGRQVFTVMVADMSLAEAMVPVLLFKGKEVDQVSLSFYLFIYLFFSNTAARSPGQISLSRLPLQGEAFLSW